VVMVGMAVCVAVVGGLQMDNVEIQEAGIATKVANLDRIVPCPLSQEHSAVETFGEAMTTD
jgi:hypothetical protein